MSRAGRLPTGIDRVEIAYLKAVLANKVPAFGIARTALGYVLLNDVGLRQFLEHVAGEPWHDPDWISRIGRRLTPAMQRGQTTVRRIANARAPRWRLASLLSRLPTGFAYLNVGHSNLKPAFLREIGRKGSASVLVHDTIPLDFPETQRSGASEAFAAKLRAVEEHASLIICPSQTTERSLRAHIGEARRSRKIVVSHLGVTAPKSDPKERRITSDRPFFVSLGTIEPRKNHSLLLDVWEMFEGQGPELLICGARGWNNSEVFERLDVGVPGVTERNNLSDSEIWQLLRQSCGLLFPTRAEGFGLPPLEAATVGCPVLCSDLPVLREILGNWPVYLSDNDRYQWKKHIERLAVSSPGPREPITRSPSWESHFETVFAFT